MRKSNFILSLMMIVMMVMCPQMMWADDEEQVPSISNGSSFTTDISSNGTYYPFTPATTGYYSFTISQAVQAAVTDDYWNLYSSLQVCTTLKSFTKLVAGDTYYLYLLSTGDAITGATVTVAACDAPTTTSTMTGTTTTETVPAYGVKYVKYVPTANHRYYVSVTGADNASAVIIEKKGTDDYSEAFATWIDGLVVYLLENGKEYVIGLSNSAAEEKELTLTLNEDNTTPFINGTSYTISTLDPHGNVMLRFTPAETKEYTFSINNTSVWVEIHTEDGWENSDGATSVSTTLTAGKTYYIDIYNTWNETSNNITLTVSGGGVQPALALGDNTSINVATASGGGYVSDLIPFTPAESATYSFAMQGQAGCSVGIFPTASLENALGTNSLALEHDVTYYVAVMSTSQITNGTLVVTKEGGSGSGEGGGSGGGSGEGGETTLPALTVSTNNMTFPACNGDNIATFTPTEAGDYKFEVGPTWKSFALYAEGSSSPLAENTSTNDFTATGLVKDQTYYISMYNLSATTGSITITKVNGEGGGSGSGGETPTYTALTVNDNTAHIYKYDSENSSDPNYYFTFTPTESGEYTFSFSNGGSPINVYAALLTDINGNSNVGQANGASSFATGALTAEHTYYLCVVGGAHDYPSATITITKVNGSGSSYQAVQEGQANVNEITIPASQGSELVQFTAPATFRFQFKTIASDYNVSLYSGVPGEEGTTCFASGLGECQYDCTMNQTYYILLSKNITMSADEQIGLSILRVHQREMSYEWGTVCLPFPINYDPNNGNYKLYMPTKATSSELTFLEYPAGNISQGSPMAVKAVGSKNAETQKYTINIVAGNESLSMFPAKAEVVGDYTFKGTLTEKTNQTGIYFIAQNKFWWAEAAITVPAYRAYLEGPEPTNSAKAFNIVIADETDGISAINNEQLIMNNYKYLENGKVVIVKNGKKFNLNGQEVK